MFLGFVDEPMSGWSEVLSSVRSGVVGAREKKIRVGHLFF